MNFQTLIKKEAWESVHIDRNPNHMFNSVLCTLLKIFQASLPVKYKSLKYKNYWITQGIKMSCKHKRSLCALTKNSHDPKV